MEACNAWAKSHGVDAHKHGVEFRASPLGGLGAFATKAINAGDTLLLLPRGFAVTPYVCEVALQDASLARSPRAALALFLCHERARGAASPWAVWLATLPAEGLDGSAFGTSADVLAAAAATRRAENPGAAPADAYTAWMASDDAGGEPPAKSYEEEIAGCRSQAAATAAFCVSKRPDLATHLPWAIAAVATRAFRVNGVVQLLPLIEKMNHSARGGRLVVTCVEINQWAGCATILHEVISRRLTRPSWLGRAVRNRHCYAIEQDDSERTRRKMMISTQVVTSAGELALLAGATYAAGDEVFLNYFDGQDDASTPERVLAHYGFELAAS